MDGGTDLRTRRPIPRMAGEIGAAAKGMKIRCMAGRGKARVCGGSGGVPAQTHIIGKVGHDGRGNGSGRKGMEDLGFGHGGFGKKGADRVWARRAARLGFGKQGRGRRFGKKGATSVWARRVVKNIGGNFVSPARPESESYLMQYICDKQCMRCVTRNL